VWQDALDDGPSDLPDAVGHGAGQFEAEDPGDLLEAHAVVAWVLVLVDVADVGTGDLLGDELHDGGLLVVLGGVADVEDLEGDALGRGLQHLHHAAREVADVAVRSPEALAEDNQLAATGEVAGELVDRQVEAHAGREAVDGSEAQAGRYAT